MKTTYTLENGKPVNGATWLLSMFMRTTSLVVGILVVAHVLGYPATDALLLGVGVLLIMSARTWVVRVE